MCWLLAKPKFRKRPLSYAVGYMPTWTVAELQERSRAQLVFVMNPQRS